MVIRLVAHIWALDKQHRRWSRRCSRSWPMELLTRTIATALWRCCGSGSGSPSVGPAGWWASTGRPSACPGEWSNDPGLDDSQRDRLHVGITEW